MVRQAGFEPTTPAFGGQYSIHLSYWRDAYKSLIINELMIYHVGSLTYTIILSPP